MSQEILDISEVWLKLRGARRMNTLYYFHCENFRSYELRNNNILFNGIAYFKTVVNKIYYQKIGFSDKRNALGIIKFSMAYIFRWTKKEKKRKI